MTTREAPTAFAAARYIGSRDMRLIIVWDRVQPAPGVWNWADYDAAIERARGFNVQLALGGIGARPPAWAGGGAYHPNGQGSWRHLDELAFVRFVSAAARRYGDRVRLWSILNEADLTGFPAKRYAALFARSRRAIRRFDGPRARVLWGEFSANHPIGYTDKALEAARRPVVADGFALHPYSRPFALLPGGIAHLRQVNEHIARWARGRRARLAVPGGGPLPVYATEYGCLTRGHDEQECALQWEQGLQQATRHGLRQIVAYQMLPTDVGSWDTSIVRSDGAPSLAMQLIASWVRGRRSAGAG